MKELANMSYRDLLEEEWYMLSEVSMLFSKPKAFFAKHARPVGLFLCWVSLVLFLVSLMYGESKVLTEYLSNSLSALQATEVPSS